jgi:putative sigma-54 modulation protein
MKVTIKATNLKLTPGIKKAIEEKIATLDKFIPYIDTSVEAFVEVALETRHHKKGKIYYAEANIKVLGRVIRSEAREDNIYRAINMVKDELQRALKEYKKRKIRNKN